jgi:hypothetical protein
MQLDQIVPSPTEIHICQSHCTPLPLLLPALLDHQAIHVTMIPIYFKWSELQQTY